MEIGKHYKSALLPSSYLNPIMKCLPAHCWVQGNPRHHWTCLSTALRSNQNRGDSQIEGHDPIKLLGRGRYFSSSAPVVFTFIYPCDKALGETPVVRDNLYRHHVYPSYFLNILFSQGSLTVSYKKKKKKLRQT